MGDAMNRTITLIAAMTAVAALAGCAKKEEAPAAEAPAAAPAAEAPAAAPADAAAPAADAAAPAADAATTPPGETNTADKPQGGGEKL